MIGFWENNYPSSPDSRPALELRSLATALGRRTLATEETQEGMQERPVDYSPEQCPGLCAYCPFGALLCDCG